ncbi:PUR family DNA/RNA-binding protein [Psychroflexus sp. CAK57W]|uniref:PUR family DNA/RNA-binding protein n=1 Tax=Psychroflexus curvus TaxID=2873595 RepID=UPI001CCA482A|nr:PUR family DNA/RNA-binding protein [Psychroflexus curvus]MBZ9787539.1 PUR family DNA/RNA-binding protein [Psychroflexus curvus]
MSEQGSMKNEDIFSKVIRAGRRTYFFDVRSTKADDYYLTITESKKFTNEDGSFFYRKHKIYLYKEDFENFKEALDETTNFIIDKKGEEVISDKHQKDFTKPSEMETSGSIHTGEPATKTSAAAFTNISFDDI